MSKLEEIKEAFEDKLNRFAKFLNIVKGNQDLNLRANLILDAKKPQTSSNLSTNQIDFVSISYFIADSYPELKPLKDFAEEFLYTSLSKEGWGIDHIIAYEQAIGEKRLMQLGLKTQDVKQGEKTQKSKE
jgi:hypothetical protein